MREIDDIVVYDDKVWIITQIIQPAGNKSLFNKIAIIMGMNDIKYVAVNTLKPIINLSEVEL
jgi:hypothetical protein